MKKKQSDHFVLGVKRFDALGGKKLRGGARESEKETFSSNSGGFI